MCIRDSHAGDGGLLGMEEQEVIIPAMKEMEEKGILCYGPYAVSYTHLDVYKRQRYCLLL